MRKLKRAKALAAMKAAGLRRICSKKRAGFSHFSQHWREYV